MSVYKFDPEPTQPLGPTGKFPQGKVNPSDEGELKTAIFAQGDQVVIDWGGKPITWLSLPAKEAREFAMVLLKFAGKIDGLTTTVEIKKGE